jgi:hypothetical protein
MITAAYFIVTLLLATALYFGIQWFVRTYSRYRGTRIVTCPETGKPAIVEIDALHASLTSTVGLPDIRLRHCARWPLLEQCGQECLENLDVAPSQCLVSGVLARWYRGKTCIYCNKHFEEVHWSDHKPALQNLDGKLLGWNAIAIEELSTVLETHRAVCWDCYIVQSFRLEHPDKVVYRPWRKGITEGAGGSPAPRHL